MLTTPVNLPLNKNPAFKVRSGGTLFRSLGGCGVEAQIYMELQLPLLVTKNTPLPLPSLTQDAEEERMRGGKIHSINNSNST
jgi:hypothetical protein